MSLSEIVSPYKVIKVIFQRRYPGYLYRRELIDDSDYGGDGNLEMVNCYSLDTGLWLGNAKDARYLCIEIGLRMFEKRTPASCAASIAFQADEQKWYGWSHRAIYGFGIGDILKKGDSGQEGLEGYELATLEDAKDAALRFSESVS